jgi:hypothetical protein
MIKLMLLSFQIRMKKVLKFKPLEVMLSRIIFNTIMTMMSLNQSLLNMLIIHQTKTLIIVKKVKLENLRRMLKDLIVKLLELQIKDKLTH